MRKLLALAMFFPAFAFATEIGDMPKESGNAAQEKAFIEFIIPVIEKANESSLKDLAMAEKYSENPESINEDIFEGLTIHYRLDKKSTVAQKIEELKQKAGIIPVSMLLAQAAYASDFGRNKAALKGNNIFDRRCAQKGCGITKVKATDGRDVENIGYQTVEASVRHQIMTLNRSSYFSKLRKARAMANQFEKPFTFDAAIAGIQEYPHPKKKKAYFSALEKIAKKHDLKSLDL